MTPHEIEIVRLTDRLRKLYVDRITWGSNRPVGKWVREKIDNEFRKAIADLEATALGRRE